MSTTHPRPALPSRRPFAGFTLMELLIAMAIFAFIGTAVVTLLGQGMNVFTSGTADTSMHDRLDALLPSIREDLGAIYVPESTPAPAPPSADQAAKNAPPPAPVAPPAVRLRCKWITLTDQSKEASYPVFYAAWVRTDAREAEDPLKREAGTLSREGGELKTYDPAAQETVIRGSSLLATGGLMEVAYVAVVEDLDHPGVLTLYRAFRAPIGGDKTLLEPTNLDSLAKIRVAGRPVAQGVLDFRITWRNVFATSWDESVSKGHVVDGQPYVGSGWDSTRGRDKEFGLFVDLASLGDASDDVFPALAKVELTLAYPAPTRTDAVAGKYGPSDWARVETRLTLGVSAEELKIPLDDVGPIIGPGTAERWLKVNAEWIETMLERVNLEDRVATVVRGRRGTAAKSHLGSEPVYVGVSVMTDVPMLFKDHYVRRK